MNTITITPENISELIENKLIYLAEFAGKESPVGADDRNILIFSNNYTDRLAESSDIDYILNHYTKTVYATFEPKNAALSPIVDMEGIIA